MDYFNDSVDDYQLPECDFDYNGTNSSTSTSVVPFTTYLVIASNALIFITGVTGNGLVIYVVLRFAKMKTVTNLYIVNLAVSDLLFLVSLPLLSTTAYLKYWIFGSAVCKIHFVLYSISFFAGVFTLTALSADRYMAVCHAIKSQRYRKPQLASLVIIGIWSLSFFVMLPTILYAKTVPNHQIPGKLTCTIEWPSGQPIPTEKAYTWYTFLLGFGVPIPLISIFYLLVILRLRNVGPAKKSKETRKNHRKVTRMVLAVLSIYIVCWLPFWCFQVNLTLKHIDDQVQPWEIIMFSVFTVLSYSNSMLNPILYAFLSENFRKSFVKAFKCTALSDINRSLYAENSVQTRHRKSRDFGGRGGKEEIELRVKDKDGTTEHTIVQESHLFSKKNSLEENNGNVDEKSHLFRENNDIQLTVEISSNHGAMTFQTGADVNANGNVSGNARFIDKEIQTKTPV